jgi:hypothetical protein
VVPETFSTSQPEWSPNGKWLYYLSDQSGRLAVWALALTMDGKVAGSTRPILDLTGTRLLIAELRPRDIGLTVAADKLALAVAEYSGTIWSVR